MNPTIPIIVFILVFVFMMIATAGERVPCAPDYPRGNQEYKWAYREVDGRQCWYQGRHKPIAELYWADRQPPREVVPGIDGIRPSADPSTAPKDEIDLNDTFEGRWHWRDR